MGKTTNILDLNNRLEKVEKENIAQNSYTSLKNKPKINNITLTGNKSLADIGAAAAADVGDKTELNTTDKSSLVAAINEVNSNLSTKQNALRFITREAELSTHESGAEWDYADISFGVTFKEPPFVSVLPYSTGVGPIPIALVSVSTTECKIGTYRNASTSSYKFIINVVGEV